MIQRFPIVFGPTGPSIVIGTDILKLRRITQRFWLIAEEKGENLARAKKTQLFTTGTLREAFFPAQDFAAD